MEIKKQKIGLWRRILSITHPERCPYCNKVIRCGALGCEDCIDKIPHITYRRTAAGGYMTVSAAPYTEGFKKAVKDLKFKKRTQYRFQLAVPMAEVIADEFGSLSFDMISYVPLHPKKQKERGFNQSELLAKELSALLGIPLESTLIKTRNNEPQHTLRASKREKNVKGAYRVRDKKLINCKNILLVDDIITTGHTLGECARTLEKAGAESIRCATFATVVVKTT